MSSSFQVYGDVRENDLREAVEMVRDALLQSDEITQVDLIGVRDQEIIIEIPQETLRRYGLKLRDVSDILRADSLEVPAGSIDSSAGNILVRIDQRNDWARDFAEMPIVTTPAGGIVRLGDLATTVSDGFEDTDVYNNFNGLPSIEIKVYRVGDQTPASVADAAYEVMAEIESSLPPNVWWGVTDDDADLFKERRDLLLKNIGMGLVIVLVVLGLFLELRLAFWVMMGIPISFLGTILLLPAADMSINMISMFAFLISLGIVVDDAIVVGENVYEYRQRGLSAVDAAIQGARDVSMPVYFRRHHQHRRLYPPGHDPWVPRQNLGRHPRRRLHRLRDVTLRIPLHPPVAPRPQRRRAPHRPLPMDRSQAASLQRPRPPLHPTNVRPIPGHVPPPTTPHRLRRLRDPPRLAGLCRPRADSA